MTESFELLPVLLPLLIVELTMKVVAIRDILKTDRKLRFDRRIWIFLILFMTLGWAIYFIFGKED